MKVEGNMMLQSLIYVFDDGANVTVGGAAVKVKVDDNLGRVHSRDRLQQALGERWGLQRLNLDRHLRS